MIPKVIHYCWFGGKEKSRDIETFIETWKATNPDFLIKEWNENNFDIHSIQFVEEAYEAGKFAFVSDVVRLYALLTEGGVYLDTDVELLHPFPTEILSQRSLVGFERSRQLMVGTAVIGTERNHPFWKTFFERYKIRHFKKIDGGLNMTPNVDYLTEVFLKDGLKQNNQKQKINDVTIYPYEYFSPKNYTTKRIDITENTISIHHFSATWQPLWKKILLRVWVPLSVKFPHFTQFIKRYF